MNALSNILYPQEEKVTIATTQQHFIDHLERSVDWNKVFGKELRDLSFFALMALKLPERMVYYATRDEKLCEIFADLFLGVTPGGLGKRKPITRAIFDAIRYPYFGLG